MKIVQNACIKFIHSEKATKFCEINTVDLFYVGTVKSTVEILQTFVTFSEFMNFEWMKSSSNSFTLKGSWSWMILIKNLSYKKSFYTWFWCTYHLCCSKYSGCRIEVAPIFYCNLFIDTSIIDRTTYIYQLHTICSRYMYIVPAVLR